MANYLVVSDNQRVQLGPTVWNRGFIQSTIDKLLGPEVYTVPPAEQGYIQVTANLEIVPVTVTAPVLDPLFQDPVGPNYTFSNNAATMSWGTTDRPVHMIQDDIKSRVASMRYDLESANTTANIQNTIVTLDTTRGGRGNFTQIYGWMQDGQTVGWKFPEKWLNISKTELGLCIQTGALYIQTQYVWEQNTDAQLANINDIPSLKNLWSNVQGYYANTMSISAKTEPEDDGA